MIDLEYIIALRTSRLDKLSKFLFKKTRKKSTSSKKVSKNEPVKGFNRMSKATQDIILKTMNIKREDL